jgi:uncharacterized protein
MFEFDPAKSAINRAKHGIDFMDAQALWRDEDCVVVSGRTSGEARWLVVGLIDGRHWCAVITLRGEAVRIISVRRARDGEIEGYERKKDKVR